MQADAGTRTASITGGYVALAIALRGLAERGVVPDDVLSDSVAAVSVGIVDGEARLDLCYDEDAGADVDFNVVMTGSGDFVEVQGTAEGAPFTAERPGRAARSGGLGHRGAHEDPARGARRLTDRMPLPPRIAIATRNDHKLREIGRICADWPVTWLTIHDHDGPWPDVEETGDTYLENALLKAHAVAAALGEPSMADDSGIEVDALGGKPGPRSARFAGETATDDENLRAMIQALAGVPSGGRSARYRCVAAVAWPDGRAIHAEGVCEGSLIGKPRGDGRVRLRPDLRAGRLGRDDGRALGRAEGQDQPPWEGVPSAQGGPGGVPGAGLTLDIGRIDGRISPKYLTQGRRPTRRLLFCERNDRSRSRTASCAQEAAEHRGVLRRQVPGGGLRRWSVVHRRPAGPGLPVGRRRSRSRSST